MEKKANSTNMMSATDIIEIIDKVNESYHSPEQLSEILKESSTEHMRGKVAGGIEAIQKIYMMIANQDVDGVLIGNVKKDKDDIRNWQ